MFRLLTLIFVLAVVLSAVWATDVGLSFVSRVLATTFHWMFPA